MVCLLHGYSGTGSGMRDLKQAWPEWSAGESSPPGNSRRLCFVPSMRLHSAGTGALGRSQTVRAVGPVLSTDIIPLVWNDRQPLPEDESRPEVEKQEMFPGQEHTVDFQGTFTPGCASAAGPQILQHPRTADPLA